MKIKQELAEALGKQVSKEFYAAYLYYSMAGYFESKNLKGFSAWLKKHAKEELTHGEKIYEYVHQRGGRVRLEAIAEPKSDWKDPSEAIADAYNHELKVTGMFDELIDLARKEKDNATISFLQWFINEQVEEEAVTLGLLEKVKMAESPAAMLVVDRSLQAH